MGETVNPILMERYREEYGDLIATLSALGASARFPFSIIDKPSKDRIEELFPFSFSVVPRRELESILKNTNTTLLLTESTGAEGRETVLKLSGSIYSGEHSPVVGSVIFPSLLDTGQSGILFYQYNSIVK
jgi:hypothetical protein